MILNVWFFKPSQESGVVNNMVARIDGPYCHCELQFNDKVACTVYMGTSVRMKAREFDETFYDLVRIECSAAQMKTARNEAERQFHDKRYVFDIWSATRPLFKLSAGSAPHGTFCSKLVVEILKKACIVGADVESSLTPSHLYRVLSSLSHSKNALASDQVSVAVDWLKI